MAQENQKVLLTGFAPYGGRAINPASAVVDALDGQEISGATIVGRKMPVDFGTLREAMAEAMVEVDPIVVIALGLWPGEAMIRLEQVGINLADFEIPDNGGNVVKAQGIEMQGPAARRTTLPVWKIHERLLDKGVPARLSSTAGTFLCNALLYSMLGFAERHQPAPLAGFIHLPYLPEQVAGMVRDSMAEGKLELHQRADVASMSLGDMVSAVCVAIAESLEAAR